MVQVSPRIWFCWSRFHKVHKTRAAHQVVQVAPAAQVVVHQAVAQVVQMRHLNNHFVHAQSKFKSITVGFFVTITL